MNKQNITIYDARKNTPGKFHESGFTLIELDELPNINDWRSAPQQNPEAEIIKFHKYKFFTIFSWKTSKFVNGFILCPVPLIHISKNYILR